MSSTAEPSVNDLSPVSPLALQRTFDPADGPGSPDLPAITAYSVHYGLGTEAAVSEWKFITEGERAKFRALADAVLAVAGLRAASVGGTAGS